MRVSLVSNSFDKYLGQGVYLFAGCLYEQLVNLGIAVNQIDLGTARRSTSLILNKNVITNLVQTNGRNCHFIMPELAIPTLRNKNAVVTFHDLIPFVTDDRHRMFTKYFKMMCHIAKRATKLVAVSHATKKDIINFLGVPEDKIIVIHEGIEHNRFYHIKKQEKDSLTIGYVGGLGKRKNAETILRAAKLLEEENLKFKLSVVGATKDEFIKLKERLKLKNVEILGLIDDKTCLFNSFDIFVFPSLYEGFGLPVLEAMACGLPVITSNVSSIPELAGKVGTYLENPKDEKELADKIRMLANNKNLRSSLSKKGIKRAKEFTWKKTAQEHLAVYEELFG